MIGEDIYNTEKKSVEIDLSRRSHFGSSFITLASRVEERPARLLRGAGLRSRLVSLESGRPGAGGEVRCRVVRPPASARALTGFLPVIAGYNGDNGLIRHMAVWECEAGAGAGDPGDCGAECGRLLLLWTPGSGGEALPVNTGLALAGGRLRLEVTYNPGTGWLYDSSGMELFYTSQKNLKEVPRILRGLKFL